MRTITKNRWNHARILQRGVFIPTRFDGLTVCRSTASGANIAVQFSCYRCALLVGCSGGLGRDVRRPAPADEIVNICMPSRHSDTGRPSSLTKTCAPTAAYGFEGSNCRAEGASHSNCSCTKMPAPSLHKIKRYSVVPQLQVVVADNRSLAEPKRILVHAAACDDACPDYRQEEAETIKDLKALVRPT